MESISRSSAPASVVTGGASGLGKATAIQLGKAGAKVALNYFNNESRAQAALDEVKSAGIEERKFKQLAIAKSIQLKLLVMDWKTGKLLHEVALTEIDTPDPIHSLNSYASPTPVIDGEVIYCHFGTYGTFCLNRATRDILWSRQLPLVHSVGPGSSPFVDGPRLVLIQDGVERQYVTALDKETGATVCRAHVRCCGDFASVCWTQLEALRGIAPDGV